MKIAGVSTVTFSFDLGSPYGWLAAERIDALLTPHEVVWEPVLLGGIFAASGRSSWALAGDESRRGGVAEIERRARDRALPPMVWPDPWPTSYLTIMRVTTAVLREAGPDAMKRFALAAYRASFTEGVDLAGAEGIGVAAERAGLDGALLLIAAGDVANKAALRATTDAALARGVRGVPSFTLPDGRVVFGDDELDGMAPDEVAG